jgi:hypothetical protein
LASVREQIADLQRNIGENETRLQKERGRPQAQQNPRVISKIDATIAEEKELVRSLSVALNQISRAKNELPPPISAREI